MEKRGQFYLIAAVIIVVILVGTIGIANYLRVQNSGESIKLYDISEELQLEGEAVVNFGIFNDNQELEEVLEDFTAEYGEYISEGSDVYFIYGDETGMEVLGYKRDESGSINFNIGGSQTTLRFQGKRVDRASVTEEEIGSDSNVAVDVGGSNYDFDVKKGQNFFFVVRDDSGESVDDGETGGEDE